MLAVKGSGGDLGTLTADGLALLDLDRLRALERVYAGVDREDEMVGLLDHAASAPGARRRRSTRRCTPSSGSPTSTTSIPTR